MKSDLGQQVARRTAVGIPTHETLLTSAVLQRPGNLIDLAPDTSLVVLTEVEIGVGRPDVILLNIDVEALGIRRSGCLRLNTLSEARALGAALGGDPSLAGVSRDHYKRLLSRIEAVGWLDPRALSPVIRESLLIEAKVAAWSEGIQQLARVRWAAHSAALLVPADVSPYVPAAALRHNGIGLLAHSGEDLRWRQQAPRASIPLHVDAWLGELSLRAMGL